MFDLTYEKQMENAKREWYNDGVEEGTIHYLASFIVKKVKKKRLRKSLMSSKKQSKLSSQYMIL